jgi:hypothetical protein
VTGDGRPEHTAQPRHRAQLDGDRAGLKLVSSAGDGEGGGEDAHHGETSRDRDPDAGKRRPETADFIPSQTILHFLQRLGEPLTSSDISWRLAFDIEVVTEALTALEASRVIRSDKLHSLRVYEAKTAKA